MIETSAKTLKQKFAFMKMLRLTQNRKSNAIKFSNNRKFLNLLLQTLLLLHYF